VASKSNLTWVGTYSAGPVHERRRDGEMERLTQNGETHRVKDCVP